MASVDIKVQAQIAKDSDEKFLGGVVQFFSTPSTDFVKHLLDNQIQIPTIYCSRSGAGCATPITELQQHNDHVPHWTRDKGHTEKDMVNYARRIVTDAVKACDAIKVDTTLSKSEEDALHVSLVDVLQQVVDNPPTTVYKCEQCDATEGLAILKTEVNETILCPSCTEKAESLGDAMADAAIEDMEKEDGE